MRLTAKFRLRLRSLFHRDAVDGELDSELRFHLEHQIAENIRAGMSPGQARAAALREFGGVDQVREECSDMRNVNWFHDFAQDLRYGLRVLRKSPGFTAIAILTLALGIGANTAIFSVMRQVLLQRLPVSHPEELVLLYSPGPRDGHVSSDEGDGSESFSYPMYLDLRDKNSVLSGLAAKADFPVSISVRGQTERASAELVSGNYFDVLHVLPALGRLIEPGDSTAPDASPVVLLSYPYWQKRFGSDPSILNQSVLVNNRSMTVVGVLQSGFNGIQPGLVSDLYVPITMKAVITPAQEDSHHRGLMNHSDYWVKVIGRLKPGISREQAAAGILPTYHALLDSELPLNTGLSDSEKKAFAARQIILRDGSRGRPMLENNTGSQLLTLMGMVALVLFITCANVAGLLTARGTARQKEIGIRLSLGASRWRLIRQLVLEACMLSLAGAILGLFLAHWLSAALVHYASANEIADGLSARLNLPSLFFTIALAFVCGIFFGVTPAWSATRVQLASTLKEQAGALSSAMSQARFRKILVVGQFAVTLLLVITAWGFVRSLYNLKNLDLGFRSDHVLQFSIAPPLSGYDKARSFALYAQLEQRIAALPGVRSVSALELPLIGQDTNSSNVTLEGLNDTPDVQRNSVSPGHFSNLGIPLLQGREFTLADDEHAPKVVIVNEALAQKYFKDGNALGKRMKFGGGAGPLDTQIVGVVKNSHNAEIQEELYPMAYMPYRQRESLDSLSFYVRTSGDPGSLASAVRSTIAQLDAALPIYNVRSVDEQIERLLSSSRLLALLSLSFGALAALLAAMGIYALLAYTVSQRTREIGVRMALGAEPKRVALMVLSDVGRLSAVGILVGLPLAYAASKLLNSMLFNVQSFGAASIAISLIILGAVATLAAFLPARRASRVDPLIALRYE
ncbi:MAG TPA: ABC transporter permease [Candidatus Limnocylindrales bacterium]|nr:ABC transporter permease [Candidatus Limnocylindrales bacterium]